GEAFNFGWSQGHSVLEVVEAVLAGAGRPDLQPHILDEVRGEIRHQWLSAEKAGRVLGWRPRVALEEGIARSVRWYAGWLDRPLAATPERRAAPALSQ